MTVTGIGIEAANVYCGPARIGVRELFAGRGLDARRIGNLMMEERSVNLPIEDPVTNAVNAAVPMLDRISSEDRSRIELLIVSTESGVDYSKSVASYVHEYLDLRRQCRVVEVKQACYAATAALQLAVGYVASGLSPGAKALIIGSDVALVDERAEYAEPATGAGAAALLIGDNPRLLAIDPGAFGLHSYDVLDSARPGPTFDIAHTDRSLFAYLDCLTSSYLDYVSKVDAVDLRATFDYLVMHTPFAGMVRAAHRKLMREIGHAGPQEIAADFRDRVSPSLVYPKLVGNLCSASVYLAMCSVIDNVGAASADARLGMFAYGSGCASEFFSGVIGPVAATELGQMRIGDQLSGRVELSFSEYEALLPVNQQCLVSQANRVVDVDSYLELLDRGSSEPRRLIYAGIKDFHRHYDWHLAGE